MLGIGIDSHDFSIEPAITPPNLSIQKDLDMITDFDFVCHIISPAPIRPKHQDDRNHDHNATVDRPLWIACHITARQHVDSLQEEHPASDNKNSTDNVQEYFHAVSEKVCVIIHSGASKLLPPSSAATELIQRRGRRWDLAL
jgi:hypothetical protein